MQQNETQQHEQQPEGLHVSKFVAYAVIVKPTANQEQADTTQPE